MRGLDSAKASIQGTSTLHNDDFVIADPQAGIFIVADGIGGRTGGAQASKIAATAFYQQLLKAKPSIRLEEKILREAIDFANKSVRSIADGNPHLEGMGTTLSALLVYEDVAKIVHIGDSRIYQFRGNDLELLTKDHTLVAEMVERNYLTAEGAKRHSLRNVLSRCIGTEEAVEPDIAKIHIQPNDLFLLTTDGISKIFNTEQLLQILESACNESAWALCSSIINAATKCQLSDDTTIAVIMKQNSDDGRPK